MDFNCCHFSQFTELIAVRDVWRCDRFCGCGEVRSLFAGLDSAIAVVGRLEMCDRCFVVWKVRSLFGGVWGAIAFGVLWKCDRFLGDVEGVRSLFRGLGMCDSASADLSVRFLGKGFVLNLGMTW
ncbi:hypothetical protein H5968_20215 [Sphaerospermopsis sp. LEGE 00249]|uniref:hypothetical protein n=1 Tax=Sphaerospermopsis sp. LEGE 00249 TaxID=1380707 RepID=UPI00164E4975|nr:hypothetical protein [Sphaerospermopsis sp. LEGE 00249]MBC5797413.1 hypothetical protein [Sphaerospermopsis sp. LEGE 00249]